MLVRIANGMLFGDVWSVGMQGMRMSLAEAQQAIASNWIAYRRYVGDR